MPASDALIPILDTIAPLARETKAWLVDLWGVMHNGLAPFAGAVDACRRFRGQGGIVVLLSNAPRPWSSVAAQLVKIGVPRETYDAMVSSGDVTRVLMAERGLRGIYHLGPERDHPLYDGLNIARVSAGEAAAIVCTGLFDDETETPEDYVEPLGAFARRSLPMICANPDLAVERGTRVIPCAGALAALYERLGGPVTYAGKPYLAIYEAAFGTIDALAGRTVPKAEILAIGDGIGTDIAGAHAAGVRSVFVASGVHVVDGVGLDARLLGGLFPDATRRPIAAMVRFGW